MARESIDKARIRSGLTVRREPYWGAPIARGLFVGFRKLEHGGTWIARMRDEDGRKHSSIGHADAVPYDDAVKAAHAWAKQVDAGGDTSEVQTVKEACEAYVADRRREVGDANADDADGRFKRNVYGRAIGKIKVAKLRTQHIKEWRAGLNSSADLQKPGRSRKWEWPARCRWWACRSMARTTEALTTRATSPSCCRGLYRYIYTYIHT